MFLEPVLVERPQNLTFFFKWGHWWVHSCLFGLEMFRVLYRRCKTIQLRICSGVYHTMISGNPYDRIVSTQTNHVFVVFSSFDSLFELWDFHISHARPQYRFFSDKQWKPDPSCLLADGFKYFLSSPAFGEDEPILTSIYFSKRGACCGL